MGMIEYLQTPTFSTGLGWLAVLFVIGLNGVLAFLAILSFKLRSREWPVVGLIFVAYALFNLWIPHPTVRRFHEGVPFPPADTVRIALLFLGLVTGLHALYTWARPKEGKK